MRKVYKPWVEENTINSFEVATFDGDEMYEMVGLFILQEPLTEIKAADISFTRT